MNDNSKLDGILKLITGLIDPMTKTLVETEKATKEIRASTRSRYVVLFSMGMVVLLTIGSMLYVLNQMGSLIGKMDDLTVQNNFDMVSASITEVQVEKLVSLAEEGASTPIIRGKLKKIQLLKRNPSSDQIKMIVESLAQKQLKIPLLVVGEQDNQNIDAVSDSFSDKK